MWECGVNIYRRHNSDVITVMRPEPPRPNKNGVKLKRFEMTWKMLAWRELPPIKNN